MCFHMTGNWNLSHPIKYLNIPIFWQLWKYDVMGGQRKLLGSEINTEFSFEIFMNKMKNKKYHTVGAIPISNRKI